ncbi:MAG: AsnC family transcriptional regulator [Nitrososphaerales archaeon]
MELDELDYRLAKALQEDGRLTTRQIASLIKVSEPTVRSRLKKLRELGVLNIKASLDLRKIDCTAAFLTLKLKASNIQEVLKNLSSFPEVDAAYQTFGEYDLVILATAKDVKGIQRLSEKLAGLDGVEVLRVSMLLDALVERRGFSVRVGVGVKVNCFNCRKEIKSEEMIEHEGRFFCSQVCLNKYKTERET